METMCTPTYSLVHYTGTILLADMFTCLVRELHICLTYDTTYDTAQQLVWWLRLLSHMRLEPATTALSFIIYKGDYCQYVWLDNSVRPQKLSPWRVICFVVISTSSSMKQTNECIHEILTIICNTHSYKVEKKRDMSLNICMVYCRTHLSGDRSNII